MNRGGGVYRSSLVQQMMEGNPSLWSVMGSQDISTLLTFPSSSASSSLSSFSSSAPEVSAVCPGSLPQLPSCHDQSQELPVVSWSQLLLGGIVEEEEEGSRNSNINEYCPSKRWKEEMLRSPANQEPVDVKEEEAEEEEEESEATRHGYYSGKGKGKDNERRSCWSSQVAAAAPNSCSPTTPRCSVTSSNILDFSHCNMRSAQRKQSHQSDHSNSECNSNSGAALKKPRVQSSSVQSPLKVRKEKLGDRIAALHQLVSPFGKTDTASVLSEAIGYIRFLQTQIQALSSPYLGNVSSSSSSSSSTSRNTAHPPGGDGGEQPRNALRNRGLCLVPVSFLLHVGSDDGGVDFWAHNFGMVLR